jgi:hypothetical protein
MGISIAEIANILGSGSNNLVTNCQHPNINKWAKYKPVKYNAEGDIRRNTDWWKAHDGMCGFLTPTIYNDVVDMRIIAAPDIHSHDGEWQRDMDFGNYPKCLGDFDGYDHNSQPIVHNVRIEEGASKSKIVSIDAFFGTSESYLTLDMFDLGYKLKDWYLGVGIWRGSSLSSAVFVEWFTSSKSISTNGGGAVTISFADEAKYPKGDYWIRPILSKNSRIQGATQPTSNQFMCLPAYGNAQSVYVNYASNVIPIVTAYRDTTNATTKRYVNVSIRLQNQGNTDFTFNNADAYVDYINDEGSSVATRTQVSWGGTTIAAGGYSSTQSTQGVSQLATKVKITLHINGAYYFEGTYNITNGLPRD